MQVHLISSAVAVVLGAVVSGLGLWFDWPWAHLVWVLVLLWVVPDFFLVPRRTRAEGYLDREDDLVVAEGIMFRSVTTVPFGRIQSVEVEEGPLERRHGLATLKYTTAASSASGSISSLDRGEAERLRALLIERGVERMQAL